MTRNAEGTGEPPVRGWRLIAFSGFTALAFFALVELALLVFGVPTLRALDDPFRGFSGRVSVFERDRAGGVFVCDRTATRATFNAQSFAIDKPPEGYRVFCIGGSSAYGFPWGADVAFPAVLSDLLTAARPDRVIEVVNAAGVSYASHRLRILARELVRYDPDLLIVYSGHNEFVEKSFYRSVRERAETLGPAYALLGRSRLAALVRKASERARQSAGEGRHGGGPELLVRRDRGEPVDADARDALVAFFAENLRAICRRAKARGARVILCTTPANLRDWRPARAPGHPELPPDEREGWRAAVLASETAHAAGRAAEALEAAGDALALAPEDAPTHFLAARCHEALGEWTAARAAYARACALDHALLRATDAINDATRRVAAAEGALLVDVERRFEALSPNGLVGLDWIEDYVHPTREGHEEIARLIWRAMREVSLPPGAGPHAAALEGDAFAEAVIVARRERVSVSEHTPTYLYNQGVLLANEERWAEALEKLEASLALSPASAEAHFHAGRCRERLNDARAALAHYDAARQIDPAFIGARYNLGVLLAATERLEEAAVQFREVVRLDPGHADAWNNLAAVRTRQGRFEEAVSHLEAALLAVPDHGSARANLARIRAHLERR